MSDVMVGIEWQGNNQAWFVTNAAEVFPANLTIFCNEAPNYGQYKYTDGVTALSALSWMGGAGGGGGAVDSVNGQTGTVVLDYTDVDADQSGSAASALTSANSYTDSGLAAKQATLVSGTNIKTVNGNSLLGTGNLVISAGATVLDISSIRYYGKYYTLPYSGNLSTALAGYVGAVYMFPVPIGEDHSIDALRFKVTSAVASSTIRIGLWEDNGSGLPGTLLLDSGTIPTDTTGDKTYTFTQIALSGKMFFFGIICSDNISLLGTNNPLPLLQRASGSDSAPSAVACNPPLASNPSLYPVTHYNTPIVEFRKV